MAVDHDKKKVVISIRGTLSPKVRSWRGSPRPLEVLPPTSCALWLLSPTPSLPPKDALTDLTGDAERLPVEGHHGTWLGHKVPASGSPAYLSPLPHTMPTPAAGRGTPAGWTGRGCRFSWEAQWEKAAGHTLSVRPNTEGQKDRKIFHLLVHSPQMPTAAELCEAQVQSQEFHLELPPA